MGSTNMVADGADEPRGVSSALTTSWPSPFDLDKDLFEPGKVDSFKRELNAAFETRGLLVHIRSQAPALLTLAREYPNDDAAMLVDLYDDLMEERRKAFRTMAAFLPRVLKMGSVGITLSTDINDLSNAGKGDELYVKVMGLLDLTTGIAQDKLRQHFNDLTVSPSDTIVVICLVVEKKWYLFRRNTLLCRSPTDSSLRVGAAPPRQFQFSYFLCSITSLGPLRWW